MRRPILAIALTMAVTSHASAQRLGRAENRPRLDATADTNDAKAYFDYGLKTFENEPHEAAAAFYWAARINPAWGEPLYARRAALLMQDQRLLKQIMTGNRRALESNEVRRLDSLTFRALMFSPFLYRQLDRELFVSYIKEAVSVGGRSNATPELDYAIDTYLRQAGEGMRGWLAYSDGEFGSALSHYANALSSSNDKAGVRLDRARIFAMQSRVDSATAEFNLALEEMRKKDKKDLVVFYNSKALAEYSIGVLLEGADDKNGAKEAYGRALTEDLSYYPAHMRLGLMALGAADTANALSELALASQLAPEEPHVRYIHGFVLAATGHYADAAVELKKAVEIEPYYALPHLILAQASEQLGKGKEAAAAYEAFLAHATQYDPQRSFATAHLSEIKEILNAAAAVAKP